MSVPRAALRRGRGLRPHPGAAADPGRGAPAFLSRARALWAHLVLAGRSRPHRSRGHAAVSPLRRVGLDHLSRAVPELPERDRQYRGEPGRSRPHHFRARTYHRRQGCRRRAAHHDAGRRHHHHRPLDREFRAGAGDEEVWSVPRQDRPLAALRIRRAQRVARRHGRRRRRRRALRAKSRQPIPDLLLRDADPRDRPEHALFLAGDPQLRARRCRRLARDDGGLCRDLRRGSRSPARDPDAPGRGGGAVLEPCDRCRDGAPAPTDRTAHGGGGAGRGARTHRLNHAAEPVVLQELRSIGRSLRARLPGPPPDATKSAESAG